MDFIGRIAHSVDVPVTADTEAGYGEFLAELEATVEQGIRPYVEVNTARPDP